MWLGLLFLLQLRPEKLAVDCNPLLLLVLQQLQLETPFRRSVVSLTLFRGVPSFDYEFVFAF